MVGLQHTSGKPASELISFLESCGAGSVDHSGRTLLAHLIGTFEVLVRWRCEPYVCRAGLFHSIYGTVAFEEKMLELDKRDVVRQHIGTQAELLVYLFCTINLNYIPTLIYSGPPYLAPVWRDSSCMKLDQQDLRDLALIKWANVMEQCSSTSFTQVQRKWLMEDWQISSGIIPEPAKTELDKFLGSW